MTILSAFPLSLLGPGETATVEALDAIGNLRRRLLDLGFVKGSTVTMVRQSPLGDPTAYSLRGATYAIRESEARMIKVRRLGHDAR